MVNRILGHIDSIHVAQDISGSTDSNRFGPTDLLKIISAFKGLSFSSGEM